MKNTKKCEVCGRELPLSDFSKSYRNRCRECVAAQVRSERQNKRTEKSEECSVKQSQIDWEQRRFELIKAALQGLCANFRCNHDTRDIISKWAIGHADDVIEKLKKEYVQQKEQRNEHEIYIGDIDDLLPDRKEASQHKAPSCPS